MATEAWWAFGAGAILGVAAGSAAVAWWAGGCIGQLRRRLTAGEVERQSLEQRAATDELTSLTNRRGARAQLRALNNHAAAQLAVFWCDIDHFKRVNDIHGHAAGDEVLEQLADRLRKSLRSAEDLAARMGGDELLVALHGVQSIEAAIEIAERLRRSAEPPIETAAGPVQVSLSIGVTLAAPLEPTDQVLARADRAMYRAKHEGRNRVVAIAADDATPIGQPHGASG
ncbi:MAG: hypothetical protein RLZZ440_2757 [Planctomycetota bacterium]|jgi:two-component system cell cycle response regulator